MWVLALTVSILATLGDGGRFGPPMDGLTRRERQLIPATATVTVADGILVATTLLGAAARRRRPAPGAPVL